MKMLAKTLLSLALVISVAISVDFDRDYIGVAFSAYTKRWEGNHLPDSYSFQDIKNQLNLINTKFRDIATYGMDVTEHNLNKTWDQCKGNCLVARAAAHINRQKNRTVLHVAQGILQQEDSAIQQKEIDNALAAAQEANSIHADTVWALVFTNEFFTDEVSGKKILAMISANKNRAHQLGLKVGTRIYNCEWIMNSGPMPDLLARIVRESDYIMCNVYPYPPNVYNVQTAVDAVGTTFLGYGPKFTAINANIQVMIGETGWPSQGIAYNDSPNNVQNLRDYWTKLTEWAAKKQVKVYMFEAIDEPWKSSQLGDKYTPSGPNGAEGHYGWWQRVDNSEASNYTEKV